MGTNTPATIGGDAAGAVTEDLNVTAGNLTDTGALTITDPDSGEARFQTTGITASAGALGAPRCLTVDEVAHGDGVIPAGSRLVEVVGLAGRWAGSSGRECACGQV